jgi:hypothetical protein
MPGGKGNIQHEDGIAFSKENQPPNRGRKPKVFSELSRDFQARGIEKATPEAVKEAYEYLLALTLQEIDDIAGTLSDKTNDYPVLLRAAAKELKGKRTIEILREMLDRAHGKSKQAIEHKGAGENGEIVIFSIPHNDR